MSKLRALPLPAAAVADSDLVPLERSVGYHVRQLAESWEDVMDQSAEAHGVTVSQWRYLRELWEEDALTVGDLTRRVGRQGPTTVVAVQLSGKSRNGDGGQVGRRPAQELGLLDASRQKAGGDDVAAHPGC